jgi:uncharacterized protein YndB with AHSA1/START domain
MIDENGDVAHEVRFSHPIERVWDAIAHGDALAEWLMPNDFAPRVGHRFQLVRDPGQTPIDAEILELDPPHRMCWSWVIDGTPTVVVITLRADGGETVLHLEHRGLPDDLRSRFEPGWLEKFDALESALKEG